jgi:hypothetical protein
VETGDETGGSLTELDEHHPFWCRNRWLFAFITLLFATSFGKAKKVYQPIGSRKVRHVWNGKWNFVKGERRKSI